MIRRKFLFPRIHGPDHDLCIRSISNIVMACLHSTQFLAWHRYITGTMYHFCVRYTIYLVIHGSSSDEISTSDNFICTIPKIESSIINRH